MSLQLTPQLEDLIRQKVEAGLYPDAAEVVREALRLLDEHDRLRILRAELRIGLEQIERGELIDLTPELLDQLVHESEENARRGKPIKDAVKP